MTTTQSILGLFGWLAITFLAAWFGSRHRPDAWYRSLAKLSCNPPDWVFAPVWLALYVMMAVAAWMVWSRHDWAEMGLALGLYLVQLSLNVLWPWIFFKKHQIGWALFDIALLWVAVFTTMVAFWNLESAASMLLLPYLVWISFATALNAGIWQLNPLATDTLHRHRKIISQPR